MIAINPAEVPSNPLVRASWIQGQLRIRGHSFTSLAETKGLHKQALSVACRVPHLPAEKVIAEALGTKPEVLFPERYYQGRRIPRTRNRSSGKDPRNGKARLTA
jgi:lambda repressor-like predicted transcriptional regulator